MFKFLPSPQCGAQGIAAPAHYLFRGFTVAALATTLAGCLTALQDGPTRLYTPQEEAQATRAALPDLVALYNASSEPSRTAVRNEIIGQRLHVIDVMFAQYDEALTKESQEAGFLADATSQGLNTAGALITPAQTTKILSGVAGAVTGVKGAYQSDIVVAKTIQIVQAQMQANRDMVLSRILTRMRETTATYPLSIALTDLEDYYRAGTFTEGLIQTSSNVSAGAQAAQNVKNSVVSVIYNTKYSVDAATNALWGYLYPNGRAGQINRANEARLNALLADASRFSQVNGVPWTVQQIMFGAGTAGIRLQLAKAAGLL